VAIIPLYALKEKAVRSRRADSALDSDTSTFVGREKCVECHLGAYGKWYGSDHDLAMAVASDSTVVGDFNDTTLEHDGVTSRFYTRDGGYFVHTEGPGGEMAEFEVAYTFGFEPLQQYLIPFPGGRLQTLGVAWDTERDEWFDVYPDDDFPPDDWLHWTRNGQNWNGMCAECHSTNLQKGYDADTKAFNTTWSEIDVSCEACHGPGSKHVEWANIEPMARPQTENYGLVVATSGISSKQQVELCSPCHSRRTQFGDYAHESSGLLDDLVPAVLTEALYHADGQILDEVYVYGSFLQSKMYRNDVRCSDCHDVHSLKLVEEGNDLCLQCHRADAYDTYDHHFHRKEHEGKPSDGGSCVKCHMPESPYMVVDWRADHSIRVPRPDLSVEIGTPNACNHVACHPDQSVEWSAQHFTEWYGKARKPHYGRALQAGRGLEAGAGVELARMAGDTLYPAIVRATALQLLQSYPGEESSRAFAAALADENPLVRYTAVQNVVAPDPTAGLEQLTPLLFDPAPAIRGQVATRLAAVPLDSLEAYQQEALDEALTDYIAAMEYSLDFAHAGHNLGNLYANLGDADKARAYYETAIEIDDLFYPAKANLAILYSRVGRLDDAEKLLREILDDYPEQYDAAYSLSLLLAEMNRLPEAVRYMGLAASGMPNAPRVHYNYGLALQQLGRDDTAETALHYALRLEPRNIDYLYALADFYLKRQRFREALPIATRMAEAHPEIPVGKRMKEVCEKAIEVLDQSGN
jgi:predicted CXXCH cytochrome family protein